MKLNQHFVGDEFRKFVGRDKVFQPSNDQLQVVGAPLIRNSWGTAWGESGYG